MKWYVLHALFSCLCIYEFYMDKHRNVFWWWITALIILLGWLLLLIDGVFS